MRILITGSRDASESDRSVVERAIDEATSGQTASEITIVHGACPTGVDMFADRFALKRGFRVEKHPAQWHTYGKRAGPKRNEEMINSGIDLVLGFPKGLSKGTRGCIELAKGRAKAIKVTEL